jgi:hypothetical protein
MDQRLSYCTIKVVWVPVLGGGSSTVGDVGVNEHKGVRATVESIGLVGRGRGIGYGPFLNLGAGTKIYSRVQSGYPFHQQGGYFLIRTPWIHPFGTIVVENGTNVRLDNCYCPMIGELECDDQVMILTDSVSRESKKPDVFRRLVDCVLLAYTQPIIEIADCGSNWHR